MAYIKIGPKGTHFGSRVLGLYLADGQAAQVRDNVLNGRLRNFLNTGFFVTIAKHEFDNIKIDKSSHYNIPLQFVGVHQPDVIEPVNNITNLTPASPSIGSRFIIIGDPNNPWQGRRNQIAEFSGQGWIYFTPKNGNTVPIYDLGLSATYRGSYPSGRWEIDKDKTTDRAIQAIDQGDLPDISNPTGTVTQAWVLSRIEEEAILREAEDLELRELINNLQANITTPDAIDIGIADAGSYFSGDSVEAALQELAYSLGNLAPVAYTGDFGDLINVPAYNSHFKGQYANPTQLRQAVPLAEPGDYAIVDPGVGEPAQKWLWDSSDQDWVEGGSTSPNTTDDLAEGNINLYFTNQRAVDAQVQPNWNSTTGKGSILNKPTSLPPTGPAGGHLNGTYPNPTIAGALIPATIQPITSSTDLDNLTEPGWYNHGQGSAPANAPLVRAAQVLVTANGTYTQQEWTGRDDTRKFIRRTNSTGQWTSWVELWHTGNFNGPSNVKPNLIVSASITLTLTHAGRTIVKQSWQTITIPTEAQVPFPIGTELTIIIDNDEGSNSYAHLPVTEVITSRFTPAVGNRALDNGAILKFKKLGLDKWHIDITQGVDSTPPPPFAQTQFRVANENLEGDITIEYYDFDLGEPNTAIIPSGQNHIIDYRLPDSSMDYWVNIIDGVEPGIQWIVYSPFGGSIIASGTGTNVMVGHESTSSTTELIFYIDEPE